MSIMAGLNSSERLFVLGIAGMIAAVVLLVVLILLFRHKAGKLKETLDNEFGEEAVSLRKNSDRKNRSGKKD